MRGKFIAIYGINNIGKSTQTSLLVQKMISRNIRVDYIKYPIYDLDPTGKMLNEILRGKKEKTSVQSVINFFPGTKVRRPGIRRNANSIFRYTNIAPKEIRQKVTEEELQMWYSLNRYQYDPSIQKKLNSGASVVAEDYTGTGLSWGWAKGANLDWLENVNKYLQEPDLQILMDGERFIKGKEKVHLHESSDRLIKKARQKFQELAKKYNWKVVDANQSIDKVADDIWNFVKPLFKKAEGGEPIASWNMGPPKLIQD